MRFLRDLAIAALAAVLFAYLVAPPDVVGKTLAQYQKAYNAEMAKP